MLSATRWSRSSPTRVCLEPSSSPTGPTGRGLPSFSTPGNLTSRRSYVVRTDRLGRDAAEQIALLKRFRTGKVGLVAIAQHIDLATPHGRAMAQIGAVFAELERALIAERTVEALDELRRQGKAWNHPPFGWKVQEGCLVAIRKEQNTLPTSTVFGKTASATPRSP